MKPMFINVYKVGNDENNIIYSSDLDEHPFEELYSINDVKSELWQRVRERLMYTYLTTLGNVPVNHEELIELYNSLCMNFSKVVKKHGSAATYYTRDWKWFEVEDLTKNYND